MALEKIQGQHKRVQQQIFIKDCIEFTQKKEAPQERKGNDLNIQEYAFYHYIYHSSFSNKTSSKTHSLNIIMHHFKINSHHLFASCPLSLFVLS